MVMGGGSAKLSPILQDITEPLESVTVTALSPDRMLMNGMLKQACQRVKVHMPLWELTFKPFEMIGTIQHVFSFMYIAELERCSY